jgi:hypothetical protein
MHDLVRVYALRLCPWCADLKTVGSIACNSCLDDQALGDLTIAAGALERRLAHVELISTAERAARAARRHTNRIREVAALFVGFPSDETASARGHFLLWLAASVWIACLLALASTMGHRVLP